jgi:hypothetical protein
MGQPCGGRQVSIGSEHSSAFDFHESASGLGFEDANGMFDLVESVAERVIGKGDEVVHPQFVERRAQRAHDGPTLSNTRSTR